MKAIIFLIYCNYYSGDVDKAITTAVIISNDSISSYIWAAGQYVKLKIVEQSNIYTDTDCDIVSGTYTVSNEFGNGVFVVRNKIVYLYCHFLNDERFRITYTRKDLDRVVDPKNCY